MWDFSQGCLLGAGFWSHRDEVFKCQHHHFNLCCSQFLRTDPHSSAKEAIFNSRDTVAGLGSPNVSWFKKILKKPTCNMNRCKTKTLERDLPSATRPGTASAVSRVHVPSKEPRVQMRIYGAHSQLLKPGEKMQFNALCQITGYACSPGILERCMFRLYLCHIGGPRKLEKVNLRRLCPLVTIFSGRSATSI